MLSGRSMRDVAAASGGRDRHIARSQVTPGGLALKYFASQRIDLRKKEMLTSAETGKDAAARGVRVRAKVVKNKVAPPMGVATFDILYDRGIDRVGDLLDAAIGCGVVRKAGAHLYFDDPGEPGGEPGGEVKLGHGRERAVAWLSEPECEGLAARLEAATRERFSTAYDASAGGTATTDGII